MTRRTQSLCRRGFGRRVLQALAAVPIFGAGIRSAVAQPAPTAGDELSVKSHILGTGADLLQNKAALDAMSLYLNGFHFYADDMGRQIEAHHFCTHLTQDLHQCVIFDANDENARLIGIEYIISARLFETLPRDEKRLWHSHDYEIKSGQLLIPGIPEAVERTALADLTSTYGKTWHTWQVDRGDPLPLGIPQLMMGFTADGQIDPALLQRRDERLDISSAERRQARAELPQASVDPLANAWQSGETPQTTLQQRPVRNRR